MFLSLGTSICKYFSYLASRTLWSKSPSRVYTFLTFLLLLNLLSISLPAQEPTPKLIIESLNGPITLAEKEALVQWILSQPDPPDNNFNNSLVYGDSAQNLLSATTAYELFQDPRLLERMVKWSDQILASRNDQTHGRIIWTGKRELCWPNAKETDIKASYSGTENGMIAELILGVAHSILRGPTNKTLKSPSVTNMSTDTGRNKALHYIREIEQMYQDFLIPAFIHSEVGYRQYVPTNEQFWLATRKNGPIKSQLAIPWNQQLMINAGLYRLIACHRLLKDGTEKNL